MLRRRQSIAWPHVSSSSYRRTSGAFKLVPYYRQAPHVVMPQAASASARRWLIDTFLMNPIRCRFLCSEKPPQGINTMNLSFRFALFAIFGFAVTLSLGGCRANNSASPTSQNAQPAQSAQSPQQPSASGQPAHLLPTSHRLPFLGRTSRLKRTAKQRRLLHKLRPLRLSSNCPPARTCASGWTQI
jgi:hypothetical protein